MMNVDVSDARRRTMRNLALDSALFVAFLIATAPRFTGIAIHEWLGVAFGAAIVTHLVLHWSWIVGVTRRLFDRAPGSARINYTLNVLLFVLITIVVFTGLMISETALPWFGINMRPDRVWRQIHHLASDASVFLVGLHIALHWNWIVRTGRRMLAAWFPPSMSAEPASVMQREVQQ
jgi:hypothetical protein